MALTDPQIDAAVVLMKARAAMCAGRTSPYPSTDDANSVLREMHETAAWALTLTAPSEEEERRGQILDTMNLCALALSLLPGGEHE